MNSAALLATDDHIINHINFRKEGISLKDFLHLKDVIDVEQIPEQKDALASAVNLNLVKSKDKIELAAILQNRWMLWENGDDSIYIIHVPSQRVNVFYQIVLGGQEWDGIYEFSFKGKKIDTEGFIIDNRRILYVESKGNYDPALFKSCEADEEAKVVLRAECSSDEEFKQALLNTGLISEDDLDIYYKPEEIIKPYLNKVLPRLILK